MAQVSLALPIRLITLVVRQALTGEAGEEVSVLQEASHVGEEVVREKLLVLLACFHIIVQKVHLKRVR